MKKIVSFILSFVLILSVSVCAFAKEDTVPFVLVTGMNVLPLYKDYGTQDEEKVWPMPAGAYLDMGKKLVLPAARYLLDKNSSALLDSTLDAANEMLEYIKCDDNGESIYNVSTPEFPLSMANYPDLYAGETKDEQGILNAACQKYGSENVYFYNYDWRLDPLEHADGLDELIKSIMEEKNCDKVNLACCSMGGMVVMSYLYKYGSDDVKNIMMLSTAFQGVEAVGDMYTGELYFDKDALFRRIINLGKGDVKEFIYKALTYAFDKTGAPDKIVGFANGLVDEISDELYDRLLKEVFGNFPSIMDLCALEDYESAKAYMLDEEKNSFLISRTDEYIYNVQAKAKDLLDSAKKDGVNVYIVCQYNMQSLPVSKSCDINNDLLIDVKYASGGAVCADLEKTLPQGYVQQADDGHSHLSPDGVIDASVCMYPDSTWFIKDQAHVDYNVGETTDFIFWLADGDSQLTVFDNPEYTQFMIYDYDSNDLEPMNPDYKEPIDLFEIVKSIFEFCIEINKKCVDFVINFILSEVF